MTKFRVLKPHCFEDHHGRKVHKAVGTLVDVNNRHLMRQYTTLGIIGPSEASAITSVCLKGAPSDPYSTTPRYGFWIKTSKHYSGGRIHMFQFAWTLANAGAEVFLITNSIPKWKNDYPECQNLQVLIDGQDKIPIDIDVVITDSKSTIGWHAVEWKRDHPRIPLVCFNFETPNWVAEFAKKYADKLTDIREVFLNADMLMANSKESMKYLLDWIPEKKNNPAAVLPPAVNTFALAEGLFQAGDLISKINHPYAIWSARPANYKGSDVVRDAIWKLDFPFDLVTFGHFIHPAKDTKLHKHHSFGGFSDAHKYGLMSNATVTLAPSLFEGFGMVPMESLCSGTPVIVYDLPILRQIYGGALTYVKHGDKKAFCKKTKSVITKILHSKKPQMPVEKYKRQYGMEILEKKIKGMPYFSVNKKRVSAQLISYWGFCPETIKSIYPHVDEIVIAHGPVELSPRINDGSLERIQNIADPENKIKLEVRDSWADKVTMREWCCKQITGNYHLILDGDEIWVGLDKWLAADIPFGSPRWINFWHDSKHWVHDTAKLSGQRWGKRLDPHGSTCPHYRCSFWRNSYKFRRHPMPYDISGQALRFGDKNIPEICPETMIYHLGHALPKEIMRAKHEFYLLRDGRDTGRINRMTAWKKWADSLGDCGDGIVEEVSWKLPTIVKTAFKNMAKWDFQNGTI